MSEPSREDRLEQIERALEQAQDCIRGETPEDMTFGEAEDDTISKIRAAIDAVAALRAAKPERERVIEDAVAPFVSFASAPAFKYFDDSFVLTKGSQMAMRQLTAGDLRKLVASLKGDPA